MVLDECVSYNSSYSYAKESLKLTHSWLDRSIIQHNKIQDSYGHKQFLFPIVQGAFFDDLNHFNVLLVINFTFMSFKAVYAAKLPCVFIH